MNTRHDLWSTILMISLAFLLLYSCRPVFEEPIIPPSQFTKQQRESLGDKIKIAIAFQDDRFPVLPNIPPYDTTIYQFVQTLYDQATNEMRQDRRSPQSNKWDPNRSWKVTILNTSEKNIFVVPGGGIYMTTGLLKSLETEHELYYLLAFEANLMNEQFLFFQIINRINTNALTKIAEGSTRREDPSAEDIVAIIDNITFESDQVRSLDKLTIETICNSSIMHPFGVLQIANQPNNDFLWLDFRSNYFGREDQLRQFVDEEERCGEFTTNGNYARFVLNKL